MSHFNTSTTFYSFMYSMMALAATAVSLITLYIAFKFFNGSFPELPSYYLWSIRFSLILFLVFSLEGFLMGASLTNTLGNTTSDFRIPFLNWSLKNGDLRIAHFVGMHSLQILPLLSYYLLRDVKLTIAATILYTFLACYILYLALQAQ